MTEINFSLSSDLTEKPLLTLKMTSSFPLEALTQVEVDKDV